MQYSLLNHALSIAQKQGYHLQYLIFVYQEAVLKFLHSMVRIANIAESLRFYCDGLGLIEKRRKNYPDGKFTLIFLGDGNTEAEIELTHNWDTSDYDLGNGFGHIAIGAPDIVGACERVREYGGQVTREPGPMKHGTTVIAFVKDPDGYTIEFIER